MPIHFCTFGSIGYEKALKRIKSQAIESNFFTTIDIYNSINTPGINKYSSFIKNNKRGYGYWIWKPLVILDMMKRYTNNDDIIIYADAGCEIIKNDYTTDLFNKYINDVVIHPSHRLGFVNKHLEYKYTKQDLFEHMNLNEDTYKNTNQICGGIQILLNTIENKSLMKEWLSIMTIQNFHFVDDSSSILKNDSSFIEHRHDQSVISLLKKKYGFCPEEYGTIFKIKYLPIHPSRKRKS